jgi:uncharacterized protein YkwD
MSGASDASTVLIAGSSAPARVAGGSRGGLALAVLAVIAAVAGATSFGTAATARAARSSNARPGHGCPGSNIPATSGSRSELQTAVLCLVNKQRAAHHLPALHGDRGLNRSAQRWTNQMVASGVFSHGSDFGSRLTAAGVAWSAAGENIATGYPTPREVVGAWMGDAGHCGNILDPSFREMGTGASVHPVRGWASGPGTWTQDFALPIGERALSRDWGPANGCPYGG